MSVGHRPAFIDQIQSRSWRVLALVIALVVLASVLLFVGSSLSTEMADDDLDGPFLLCVLVLFLSPLLPKQLLLALYGLPKLSSIWYSTLERPG